MANPTLQAEGAIAAVTTGSLTVTLPAHQTDDILVVCVSIWAPATAGNIATTPALAGWTKQASVFDDATPDGEHVIYWRRATSAAEANPVFTRGAGWDVDADTCFSGRAYVIRGCETTGDPFDQCVASAAFGAANQPFPAVTVSAVERLVVQFLCVHDNTSVGTAPATWTAGTAVASTVGTDAGYQTFRKNSDTSTSSTATTVAATNLDHGVYVFFGVSFKPPAPVTFVPRVMAYLT